MFNKIIAYILISISIAFGGHYAFNSYIELKKQNAEQESKIVELDGIIKSNKKTYDDNLELIQNEVKKANDASKKAIANASISESKFIDIKRQLNETNSRYNDLISNGYRLQDPYRKSNTNSTTNSDSQSGNDKENHSATATGSNSETGDNRLSEGFTRYLIDRAIKANGVVGQLTIVQDYAIRQHAWILDNCNAVEAKE